MNYGDKELPNEIQELVTYFSNCSELPENLMYREYVNITDIPKFIEGHLNYVVANHHKRGFQPYLDRLKEIRDLLQSRLPTKNRGRKKSKH